MQNGSKNRDPFEEILTSVALNLQEKILEVIDKDHPGFGKRMKEVEEETQPMIDAIDVLMKEVNWKGTEAHFLYLIQAMMVPISRLEMLHKIRIEVIEALHHYIKHLSHDPESAERWEGRADLPTLAELER